MASSYFGAEMLQRQGDNIGITFIANRNAYNNLMSLRSHWFADWAGPWGRMVGDYISDMSAGEFWKFIPNGNGKKDPYYRDMMSRVTGEEHNLPCPIMLEYPELVYRRVEQEGDNLVIERYVELVEQGYIVDNPYNVLRIKYLKMKGENQ